MHKEQTRSYLFYGEGFLTDYSYTIYVSEFFECKQNFYVDREFTISSLFKNKTVQNLSWLILYLIFTFRLVDLKNNCASMPNITMPCLVYTDAGKPI